MRWGFSFVAAIAMACDATSSDVSTLPPTPPDDAGVQVGSISIDVDANVSVVLGETAVLSFAISPLPVGTRVDVEGLPPGVTADDASFVPSTSGRYSIVLRAASDAPVSIVKILVHASVPGSAEGTAVSTMTVSNVDGSLDPSFGVAGIAKYTLPSESSAPVAIARASSTSTQMILALTSGAPSLVVTRLNDTGAFDTTFGQSGLARTDFNPVCDRGAALAVSSDGRIALSATTQPGCGGDLGGSAAPVGIVFFTSDGLLAATQTTQSIAPLAWSGASLLAAGTNALECFTVANDVSTPLASFTPLAMAVRSDGSLVAVGASETRRLVPAGDGTYTLDATFTAQVGGRAIIVDNQDRAIVLGDATLTRIGSSGAIDTSFGVQGIAPLANGTGAPTAVVETASGTGYVVVGTGTIAKTTNAWLTLSRYDTSGAPVIAFGTNGSTTTHVDGVPLEAVSAALDASGRIWVLAAALVGPAAAVMRYRIAP